MEKESTAHGELWNEDLAPTDTNQRTWKWRDYAALWLGMVICIPTYTMASSMLDQGFDWQTAIWLVFVANLIVLVPMVLIGRAGGRQRRAILGVVVRLRMVCQPVHCGGRHAAGVARCRCCRGIRSGRLE